MFCFYLYINFPHIALYHKIYKMYIDFKDIGHKSGQNSNKICCKTLQIYEIIIRQTTDQGKIISHFPNEFGDRRTSEVYMQRCLGSSLATRLCLNTVNMADNLESGKQTTFPLSQENIPSAKLVKPIDHCTSVLQYRCVN